MTTYTYASNDVGYPHGFLENDDYVTPESFIAVTSYHEKDFLAPRASVHAHDADVVYTEVAVTRDAGKMWAFRDIPDEKLIKHHDRVVSHPTNPAVIYSCSAEKGLREWGNYLTVNRLLASPSDCGSCRDLMLFPHSTDRMWMGTDNGLWETWDRGRSWTRQNRGLPNLPIVRVYLAHDGKEIIIAVFGRGLFTVPPTEVDVMLVSSDPVIEVPESNALLTNYPNPFTAKPPYNSMLNKPHRCALMCLTCWGAGCLRPLIGSMAVACIRCAGMAVLCRWRVFCADGSGWSS